MIEENTVIRSKCRVEIILSKIYNKYLSYETTTESVAKLLAANDEPYNEPIENILAILLIFFICCLIGICLLGLMLSVLLSYNQSKVSTISDEEKQ
ncbi:hypothetical protein KAFR_0A04795 [Kazachstania africana CBS 2517]|uniref:Uncharacterized protein n=1 Tax=Kazachstania africana (strain ATCC 22294 / BCRC 22015 / CBS 2517 / CECT 1963 / NBRC 1671 / NRRL Y-8276) TaxID=1071382 RepID=H2ANG5_KAZAF|nr:hypothetical protein KAFR_0A04795 [Kazachstania africana CBS 2517]CCF55915.1 hypothetical protein KAFR_0A04795 [Kazachstania africana CBS 2517]